MNYLHLLSVVLFSLLLSACSTTTNISSIPEGATIYVDDQVVGKTPLKCTVDSKLGVYNEYTIRAEKEGYRPQTRVCKEMILFGGASSIIPEDIHFELQPELVGSERKLELKPE